MYCDPTKHACNLLFVSILYKEIKTSKDKEKAQSKRVPTPKTEVGKKLNKQSGTDTMKTYRKPNE